MAYTYKFKVSKTNKGFDFEGKHYGPDDEYGPVGACKMKEFLNASQAANPDSGVDEESASVEQLEEECKAIINNTTPQPDGGSNPDENDPAAKGGDSAGKQGAPSPRTGGKLGGSDPDARGDADDAPGDEPTRPPDGEAHSTHGGEKSNDKNNAADPVDIFSGSFYLEETDLIIPNTIVPFSFTRFYLSGAASFGPFGWNWDHNFNLFIRELNTGDIALWRNLHEHVFKFDGINFEPPRGVFEKIVRVSTVPLVYEIEGKGGALMHFERPAGWLDAERIPIIWIKDQHKNKLQFSYTADDKLAEVRDDDDRFFKFEYDQCRLLVAVTDHAGRKFQYGHDEQTMQLTTVKSPATTDHPDGIKRIYHYEQPWAPPQLRHNIVRVEDANGNIYLENKYEQDPASWSFARITEQLLGSFLFQFRYTPLQWVPPDSIYINIPALRAEVMNPDFSLETYTFNYRGDLLDRRYRLNKDKSYRVVVWQYEFDEQGNPSKITGPDGGEELTVFDFANPDPRMRENLLQKEITSASGFPSPSRIVWKGKYEPRFQQLTEEKNETGATITYKYDFDLTPGSLTNTGKLLEIIQPDATLPDGSIQKSKTVFEYNTKGQVTAIIQPDGTRNEFFYGTVGNEKSRLVKQVLDTGLLNKEHTLKYDGFGFQSETVDGNGNSNVEFYNALGQVEKNSMPAVNGSVATNILHYDSDKKVISSERPKGAYADPLLAGTHIIDKIERNVLGFPEKYILSSNTSEVRILKISSDFRGQPVETINPDGTNLKKTFDERGLPLLEIIEGVDGKRIITKKVYDRPGRLVQETRPTGLTTKYEYDGFSRISKVVFPNSSEKRNKWFKNDLPESEEVIGDDGTGTVRQLSFRSFEYDEKSRKIKEIVKVFTDNPAASTNVTTTFFYDSSDRLIRSISNRSGVSTRQYDGLGRIINETDPGGNELHYIYDKEKNIIQTTSHHREPDGTTTLLIKKFSYDERNRRIELIEPDGSKTISEYDDRNLLTRQTNPSGIVQENSYNAYNNKILETHDAGGLNVIRRWGFDNMSRTTSYTDPTGQISSYTFDSVGRNYKVEFSNGFSSVKTFDDFSKVTKEQLGSGVEFQYNYDGANRISKITNSWVPAPVKQAAVHEFSYDGMDRVISAKAGADDVLRKYDSLGRLLSEKARGNTISCRYNDATGEVEKIWPDGRTEKLHHNLSGVLSEIEETVNGTLGAGINSIASFNTSGPVAFGEAIYNNDITIENSYDDRKRLTEILVQSAAGINENIKYRYDRADTRQVEAILGQNSRISYFEFDNKYRLLNSNDSFPAIIPNAFTQADHNNAINQVKASALASASLHTEKFFYDLSDDRTKYSETGNPDKNYLFLPGHKIQHDGTNAYTHFTEGSLKTDGLFEYETDGFGRIITIKSGVNIITEISYDALGRPATVKEQGKPIKSFNYLGGFVEQENENGIASRQITIQPGTGIPIAYHSALGTHYTLFDGRFNLIGLADTNGDLVETYRYKSFGQPQVYDNTGTLALNSSFDIEPVFGGQRYLPASGFYLSKKRLMNPVNGVYLSGDPLGYEDSSSLYVYAAQNPVNKIDPNGEVAPIIAAAVIIGALAGAGYCIYDAATHPDSTKYDGWGALMALPYTFGGAAVGGLAAVGGEIVLAGGGTGIFASGGTAATLTTGQTFLLYGTASATTGFISRSGFNYMFPEYVDPASPGSVAGDFAIGGAVPIVGPALVEVSAPLINGAKQMFSRAVGGNWRFFGNTWKLLWKGYNGKINYGVSKLFWNPGGADPLRTYTEQTAFKSISGQYWRQSGGADGKALHHWLFQNQSRWIPRGLRNAGFNLLEIPGPLNTWMGGRLWRELAFRTGALALLTGVGVGSYSLASGWIDDDDDDEPGKPGSGKKDHPNDNQPASK